MKIAVAAHEKRSEKRMHQLFKNVAFFLFCGSIVVLFVCVAMRTTPAMAQVEDCICSDCAASSICIQGCDASCCQEETLSLEEYCKIDLNTANKEQLCLLSGIGEQKANLIIEYRVFHGGFSTVEDVAKVSGITETMIDTWGTRVYVSEIQG